MKNLDINRHIACPHCDLICEVPELEDDEVAVCSACKGPMAEGIDRNQEYALPLSISALLLLAMSLPFTFISFSKQGLVQSIRILDAADMMLQYDQPFLATLINLTIIMLPLGILSFVLMLQLRMISLLPKQVQIFSTKALFWAKDWSMPEIFLVGVLVSLVKIISLAEISLGLSFYAFAVFVFCFVYTIVKLDRMAIWDKVAHHSEFSHNACNVRAIDEGLAACPQCQILTEKSYCPRCATKVCLRDPYNLQKTLAWTITAMLLYIPANLYPIMTTVFLSVPEPSTIIGGVVLLWHHGSYPIAMVIFIASVMVPLTKLAVLVTLVWVVKFRVYFDKVSFTKIYHVTEFLGKWSMIDVFVVAVLVALVHLVGIMEIMPGPGALFFSAMVIASMLAAHTFDPKQLWDIDQAVTNHE